MSGTTNMNDPEFFSDANIDAIAQPASFSDFGPGPNEELERAQQLSAAVREGMTHGAGVEFELPPSPTAQGARGVPSGDAIDRIADAVLARISDKLGGL